MEKTPGCFSNVGVRPKVQEFEVIMAPIEDYMSIPQYGNFDVGPFLDAYTHYFKNFSTINKFMDVGTEYKILNGRLSDKNDGVNADSAQILQDEPGVITLTWGRKVDLDLIVEVRWPSKDGKDGKLISLCHFGNKTPTGLRLDVDDLGDTDKNGSFLEVVKATKSLAGCTVVVYVDMFNHYYHKPDVTFLVTANFPSLGYDREFAGVWTKELGNGKKHEKKAFWRQEFYVPPGTPQKSTNVVRPIPYSDVSNENNNDITMSTRSVPAGAWVYFLGCNNPGVIAMKDVVTPLLAIGNTRTTRPLYSDAAVNINGKTYYRVPYAEPYKVRISRSLYPFGTSKDVAAVYEVKPKTTWVCDENPAFSIPSSEPPEFPLPQSDGGPPPFPQSDDDGPPSYN
jgi:hypothetical protein